jgi:hypothetical protein
MSGSSRKRCREENRDDADGPATTHVVTHEKLFGCQYCDFRAGRKDAVVVHERTHTGEKPYNCRYCEYRQLLNLWNKPAPKWARVGRPHAGNRGFR